MCRRCCWRTACAGSGLVGDRSWPVAFSGLETAMKSLPRHGEWRWLAGAVLWRGSGPRSPDVRPGDDGRFDGVAPAQSGGRVHSADRVVPVRGELRLAGRVRNARHRCRRPRVGVGAGRRNRGNWRGADCGGLPLLGVGQQLDAPDSGRRRSRDRRVEGTRRGCREHQPRVVIRRAVADSRRR